MNSCVSIELNPTALELQFGSQVIREHTGTDIYDGPTAVVPGREAVVLSTGDKYVPTDIVVAPIPQNYALVEWNGSYLTFS